ncbi:MAG: alpha/beta fold hydrolase [Alphaproteobacteria bacterium]
MERFQSGDAEIAYITAGQGRPVLLIHGFASNYAVNWVGTGWVEGLVDAGHKVIAMDVRGHGQSQKFYDAAKYLAPDMAGDAAALIDHLGFEAVDVIGYSMGARLAAFLTINHPNLVRRAVFGGLAAGMVRGVGAPGPIAAALEAPTIDDVADSGARTFRSFAERTKSDLKALAACMRSVRVKITQEALATIACPVLVAAGTRDPIAGPIDVLTDLIAGARGLPLEGKDHMSAVGAKEFKAGVVAFLTD